MTAPIRFRTGASPAASRLAHPAGQGDPSVRSRGDGPPPLRVVDRRVRARRRSRARARLAGAAAVTAVLAVLFGLVAIHVLLAQNQFQLDRLNARSSAAEAQYDRLRLQVAQLDSPERVVATAEGRLGMVQPAKTTYLTPNAPGPGPATAPPGTRAAATPTVSADWARVKAQLGARP